MPPPPTIPTGIPSPFDHGVSGGGGGGHVGGALPRGGSGGMQGACSVFDWVLDCLKARLPGYYAFVVVIHSRKLDIRYHHPGENECLEHLLRT